jgi:hypothetical protein
MHLSLDGCIGQNRGKVSDPGLPCEDFAGLEAGYAMRLNRGDSSDC